MHTTLNTGMSFVRSVLLFLLAFCLKPLHHKTRPTGNKLYLIGSNYGAEKDENANALFDYIQSNHYTVYYIADDSTKPQTIKRGSLKSYRLFFRADAVFFTHSLSDILPYLHKAHRLLSHFQLATRVFIQHGVIGLKYQISAEKNMSDYLTSISPSFDKMVVSSEREFQIVQQLGIAADKLAVTGLPRFDLLTPENTGPNVLVFLTWRAPSDYRIKLDEILNSSAIETLESAGMSIIVKQHSMMPDRKITDTHDSNEHLTLQAMIKTSGLLITDDSSVAWDFFYKGSEVIFFRPDSQWLIRDDDALNARIANSKTELQQLTQAYIDGISSTRPVTCDYADQRNAERVFALATRSAN